jgi:tripartite-type tricarboxylate transporter receptor subunit TctC
MSMAVRHALLAIAAALSLSSIPAQAQQPATFPVKPLRFVVPFPPGGTLDILARTVSNELGPALGQSIVVENRPGASGMIGAEFVARATPDAHTLMIASNTIATLPALRTDLPIDLFKDLSAVIELGSTPTPITVHPSFPARNLTEFIAEAKKRGSALSYNSPGIASAPHLGGELFTRAAGLQMVHVPYRGTQPAVNDLIAGHVPMMMAPLNAVIELINDKRLFAVAITDGARTRYLPDVPTLRESGIDMPPVSSWFGIHTTGGSPATSIARLNTEIARIMKLPAVTKSLESQTFEIKTGTPEAMAKALRDEAVVNAKIVKEANIKAQ